MAMILTALLACFHVGVVWSLRQKSGNCEFVRPAGNETFCTEYRHTGLPQLRHRPRLTSRMVAKNTEVTLECPSGQHPSGPEKSKCIDGVWKPRLGLCEAD
ncbi:unnamed protein product [Gongylonema pulchrum]|uniref:Sushi domain-containing protein n=1 Tax=Gongylonema pulchrum TaxID=637853 RepID=A0A183DPM7_9BILA|nr:unnamed protein product [Gongylonema pulchrum]